MRKLPDHACRVRRQVLRGAACGLLGSLPLARAWAQPVLRPPKSLRFVHTHTGEQLATRYFDGSIYVPESIGRLNHLLRDFRSGEATAMDTGLFDLLWDLQVAADREATFEVISAYRSPLTNAMLRSRSSGVAEHSLHMQGKAMDVRISGYSSARLAALARALERGGVGYYAKSDFVHVDTGRVRYW